MKYSNIILGGLVAFAGAAVAMPTQEETKKVEPLVLDLMKDDQVALKSGKKTRVEVAESAMALADKADSEAAKLLLMKGAFNLYVRAGEFDKAIETLQALQAAIPDIPPANMANIIEASLRVVSRKNGGQLYRLLDETKTRMRYTSAAKKMEKALKENPNDRQLRTKLAEHYAYLGKWDKALEHFIAVDGKAGAIAKAEQGGEAGEKAADFWWSYPTGKADELVKAFRTHAAKLYEKAIADGKITGLNKVQAERRIEETKEYGENVFDTLDIKDGLYCVIDLSGGPNAKKFPVSYLKDAPKAGWGDEYKTKKLVLRKIKAGKDPCGRYELTKDFYVGVFEVTQKQFELMGGMNNAPWIEPSFPAVKITYDGLRGSVKGSQWPKNGEVDEDSLIGKLRKKTGLRFDLPTEAQWEYACRAGTSSPFNNGGVGENDMRKLGRYSGNSSDDKGGNGHYTNVGRYQPNAWGLFDMHGNAWELCLDWNSQSNRSGIDPVGGNQGKEARRVCKGGSYSIPHQRTTSHYRESMYTNATNEQDGFRLAIQPESVLSKEGATLKR